MNRERDTAVLSFEHLLTNARGWLCRGCGAHDIDKAKDKVSRWR